jgi:integrase
VRRFNDVFEDSVHHALSDRYVVTSSRPRWTVIGRLPPGFTFHELRAKCASDKDGLESAAALLGHANSQTSKSAYRRKMPRATPLR